MFTNQRNGTSRESSNIGSSQLERVVKQYYKKIEYSVRYQDDFFEYRHVSLPQEIAKFLPQSNLLTAAECRSFGVQQSCGWEHYMIHDPEPHVLLFRRPLHLAPPSTEEVKPRVYV